MKARIGNLELGTAQSFLKKFGIQAVPVGGRFVSRSLSRTIREETGWIPTLGAFLPTGIREGVVSLWVREGDLSLVAVSVHEDWFQGQVSSYYFIANPETVARALQEALRRSPAFTDWWGLRERSVEAALVSSPSNWGKTPEELAAEGILRPAQEEQG